MRPVVLVAHLSLAGLVEMVLMLTVGKKATPLLEAAVAREQAQRQGMALGASVAFGGLSDGTLSHH
jgi:hypothetical protein